MAGKHSPAHSDSQSPKIDDLKLINGVGPAVEKRLNDVGIHTFTQLAILSPADIAATVADLTGLSSERISKQDWIGQARKLADAETGAHEAQEDIEASAEPAIVTESVPVVSPPPEPQQVQEQVTEPVSEEDVVPSMERYHPATFTIEFLLDEHNSVHNTHVVHVQSNREDTWMGWQERQLVDCLSESAELDIPGGVPDLANTEEPILDEDLTPTEEPANVEEPVPDEKSIFDEEPAKVEKSAIVEKSAAPEESTNVEKPAIVEKLSTSEKPAISEEPATTEKSAIVEEPVSTPAVVPEGPPLTPSLAHPRPTSNLRMSKMEVIENESGDIRGTLTSDKPFNVRLTLDLTEFQVPADTLLNYKATIHGKERVSHANLVVGEAQGTIVPADTVAIKVECPPLPEGFYRLAATVTVALPGTKFCVKPDTTAVIGGTLQVY